MARRHAASTSGPLRPDPETLAGDAASAHASDTRRRWASAAVPRGPSRVSRPARSIADGLTVSTVRGRTAIQDATLGGLWRTFADLPSSGVASCVGITKAVMLVSDGRIGPAFDSQVRERLGLPRPTTSREWIALS